MNHSTQMRAWIWTICLTVVKCVSIHCTAKRALRAKRVGEATRDVRAKRVGEAKRPTQQIRSSRAGDQWQQQQGQQKQQQQQQQQHSKR